MLNLTGENVERIFKDSIYTYDEYRKISSEDHLLITKDSVYIVIDKIASNVSFNPERLESHRSEIKELFSQLPVKIVDMHNVESTLPTSKYPWNRQLLALGVGIKLEEIHFQKTF